MGLPCSMVKHSNAPAAGGAEAAGWWGQGGRRGGKSRALPSWPAEATGCRDGMAAIGTIDLPRVRACQPARAEGVGVESNTIPCIAAGTKRWIAGRARSTHRCCVHAQRGRPQMHPCHGRGWAELACTVQYSKDSTTQYK